MANQYTRQYVGARYVPKFFNNPNGTWEWMSGIQYEPLTIVQYAQNSYTSKQMVPPNIGTPNSNPEYWANTGNYNGAILELSNEINKREKLITEKTYLIIGDSYIAGNNNFINNLKNFLNCENVINIAVSGAGFLYGSSTFISQLQNYNGSSPDEIIVCGGINDASQSLVTETLINKIIEFSNYAKIKFPLAKLSLCYMGYAWNTSPVISGRDSKQQLKARYAYGNAGVNFYDISWVLKMNKANLNSDRLHPSTYGSISLANALSILLRGGNEEIKYYLKTNVNSADENINVQFNNFSYFIDSSSLYLFIDNENSPNIIFTANKSIEINNEYDLLTIDLLNINFRYTIDVIFQTKIGSVYTDVKGLLIFKDNKLKFSIKELGTVENPYVNNLFIALKDIIVIPLNLL